MVNISKRMRILKPLLSLRHGPGAAILPQYLPQSEPTSVTTTSSSPTLVAPSSSQQATLLRIRLDFPPGNGPASQGARIFWRNHLRRLKYHNPALPIIVNQNAQKGTPGNPGPAWRLFLDFEGEEKALRELATEPKNPRFKELMEEELRPRPRTGAEEEEESSAKSTSSLPSSSLSSSLSSPSLSTSQHTPNPSPSQTSTPLLTSHRTISLPVLNRPAGALWFWFQNRTNCIDVPESEQDMQLADELAQHAVKADEDRQRVKKGMDQIKAKQEMLKMARREVESMKAEA